MTGKSVGIACRIMSVFICMIFLLLSACTDANEITVPGQTPSSNTVSRKASSASSGGAASSGGKTSSKKKTSSSASSASPGLAASPAPKIDPNPLKPMRGMWICYYDMPSMCESKKGFRAAYGEALDRCAQYGTNAVFVHVRGHCDAYYKSSYYPWSSYITGTQGKDPGYDPLKIMIEETHKRGMQFHAWINPYRVSATSTDITLLSKDNPARKWRTDNDTANDYRVVECDGGLYLNPCDVAVQRLIVDGVREIVRNYAVDGIHFDDYFYPTTAESFDEAQYVAYRESVSSNPMPLYDWRRANVSALVGAARTAVKSERSTCIFGISPMASVNNNYHTVYADVKTWIDRGYIDYIMPQLYFGFEYPSEKSRFDVLLAEWHELCSNYDIPLYIGLGAYRIGTTDTKNIEWSEHDDMLARQLEYMNETGYTDGYAVFAYSDFFKTDERTVAERKHFLDVIKNSGVS